MVIIFLPHLGALGKGPSSLGHSMHSIIELLNAPCRGAGEGSDEAALDPADQEGGEAFICILQGELRGR